MATVVHVIGSLKPGGVERRLVDLIRYQHESDVRLRHVVVCLSGNEGEYAPLVRALGGYVEVLELRLSLLWRFVSILKRYQTDVLHARVSTFSGWLCCLALLAGVPVRIASFHSDGDEHGNTIRYRLQRTAGRTLVAFFATDIIAVSPGALSFSGVSARLARLLSKRSFGLLPGGVRIPDASDVDSLVGRLRANGAAVVLVHVGRAAAIKRRVLAAQVSTLLGPDAHIVFVGEVGNDAELIEADESVDDSRCHFVGSVPEPQSLIRYSDVLISTSSREGLPGVVLEALAVGTPVVATNLSGARWLAAELPGIRLVPTGAAVADWGRAVRAAISDNLPSDLIIAAVKQSRFSYGSVLSKYSDLYVGDGIGFQPVIDSRSSA